MCTYYAHTNLLASKANSDGVYGGAEEDEDYGSPEPHLIGKQICIDGRCGIGLEVNIAPACKKICTHRTLKSAFV